MIKNWVCQLAPKVQVFRTILIRNSYKTKNALDFRPGRSSCKLLSCAVSLGKALAAINGAITRGLKGNSCFLAALGADSGEHLTGSTVGVLAGVTASLASLGLVDEASLSIEFLLASREDELIAALFALQSLVSVHWKLPRFDFKFALRFLGKRCIETTHNGLLCLKAMGIYSARIWLVNIIKKNA